MAAHTNHIYKGVAMNDLEVHYTLDGLMEECWITRSWQLPFTCFRTGRWPDGGDDEIPQYEFED